jgi:cell division septation protein DedD
MSEQENATAVAETTPPEETKESAKASKKKTAKPAKKKKVELPPPKKHGETFDVFLGSIVATDNPRQEPERLAQLGYSIISKDPDHSLITMALSDDIEVVRTLVNLFEEHESDEGTELDEEEGVLSKIAKRTNGLQQQQSIIALAKDLKLGQLQPILVRKLPSGYSLVAGQRRTAAVVYLHAKSVLEHHESAKVKIYEPVIEAKVGSFGNDEAFIVAIRENMNRKEFTPLQWGMIYRELTHKINPKTKKNYTVTDIANEFGQTYGNVRNRLSLTQKRQEAKVDDEGNVIKPGKGLTDEDREKLATGKMTLTAAIRKSLGAIDPFVGKYFNRMWVMKNVMRMGEDEAQSLMDEADKEKELLAPEIPAEGAPPEAAPPTETTDNADAEEPPEEPTPDEEPA